MKHTFKHRFPRRQLSVEEVAQLNIIMTWKGSGWNKWKKGTNTLNLEDCACRIDDIIRRCEKEIETMKNHLELYLDESDIWNYTSPNRIRNLFEAPLSREEVTKLIEKYKKVRCDFIDRFYKLEVTFFDEPMFISDFNKQTVLERHKRCK